MKRFRYEKRSLLSIVSVLLAVILLFVGCAETLPPEPSATYSQHTELQARYLSGNVIDVAAYANGKQELSRPSPIILDLSEISDDLTEVQLSEDPSFSDAFTYPVTDGKATIYNLKIGTIYYYHAKKSDGNYSETTAFLTEDATPRNLYVDGVTNVRDLGGYTVPEGRIRQGLLYRGGRLNQNHTDIPTPKITEQGIRAMLETLHIKTEVDLRQTANNEIGSLTASVLGDGVTYRNFPMVASNDMLSANDASISAFFACLADASSYPLYFHCSIGTDRTGFTAFLMLSVLGVDLLDVQCDYLFSNFGDIGGDRNIFNVTGFILYVNIFPGDTFAEKTENFLLSTGVTKEQIASFRKIMIEQ